MNCENLEINYTYENTGNYLVITNNLDINYKTNMVLKNSIDGLLDMKIENINNNILLKYNITSKISLVSLCNNNNVTYDLIVCVIKGISELIKQLDKYLLSYDDLLINVENVYVDNQGKFVEFCYYPEYSIKFSNQFKNFLQQLLQNISHNNKNIIELLYGIYDITNNDNYSIIDISNYVNNIKQDTSNCSELARNSIELLNKDILEENSSRKKNFFLETFYKLKNKN